MIMQTLIVPKMMMIVIIMKVMSMMIKPLKRDTM